MDRYKGPFFRHNAQGARRNQLSKALGWLDEFGVMAQKKHLPDGSRIKAVDYGFGIRKTRVIEPVPVVLPPEPEAISDLSYVALGTARRWYWATDRDTWTDATATSGLTVARTTHRDALIVFKNKCYVFNTSNGEGGAPADGKYQVSTDGKTFAAEQVINNATSFTGRPFRGGDASADVMIVCYGINNNLRIHYTSDGEDWTQVDLTGATGGSNTLVYTQNDDFVIATDNARLYRTTDGGPTWKLIEDYRDGSFLFIHQTIYDVAYISGYYVTVGYLAFGSATNDGNYAYLPEGSIIEQSLSDSGSGAATGKFVGNNLLSGIDTDGTSLIAAGDNLGSGTRNLISINTGNPNLFTDLSGTTSFNALPDPRYVTNLRWSGTEFWLANNQSGGTAGYSESGINDDWVEGQSILLRTYVIEPFTPV